MDVVPASLRDQDAPHTIAREWAEMSYIGVLVANRRYGRALPAALGHNCPSNHKLITPISVSAGDKS
jgi:hypothetical protein